MHVTMIHYASTLPKISLTFIFVVLLRASTVAITSGSTVAADQMNAGY